MKRIPMSAEGQSRRSVELDGTLVVLVTRYNPTLRYWIMDILDAEEDDVLLGVVMVPNEDFLAAHPQLKKTLGSLVLVERRTELCREPASLGTDTQLLWYAVDEEIVLP